MTQRVSQRMPDFLSSRPTPTASAAVAALDKLGVDPERIRIVPVSRLESFKGEIVGQVPHPAEPLPAEGPLTLFVSRVGLAERLPHGFLEPLPTAKDEAHVALEPGQVLEFWERQVSAYGPGRAFITSLDSTLARLDREMGRLRFGLQPIGHDDSFAREVLRLSGIPGLELESDEAIFLAAELQRLPDWLGPAEGIVRILEQLLDLPAEVGWRSGPRLRLPEELQRPLGDGAARLGEGLALGPEFIDDHPTLHVRLGPVAAAQHAALDADEHWHQRVRALLALSSPAGCECDYELVLRPPDRGTVLGDRLRARLGRSSYLSAPSVI